MRQVLDLNTPCPPLSYRLGGRDMISHVSQFQQLNARSPPNLWLTRLITYKPCVFYIPAAVVCWGFVSFFFLPLPVSIHLHSAFKSIQTGWWMNHSEWISAHLALGNNGESCCFIRRRRTLAALANFQPQYFDLKCTGRRQQDTNWTAMATK